ncbi:MAG: hypothetical protein ACTSXO_12375 [Candidatus Heimdallarchaeota archaeon]
MKKGLAFSLIILVGVAAFVVGFSWGKDFWLFRKPTTITPTIDGVINKKEWRRASHYNIPFYLDVNNTVDPIVSKKNVDGWNYISVGEDSNYYYIALDLCSDRTNNPDGEWISFFLANRFPEIYYSALAFESMVDHGYEYIFYNVSSDKPFDYELNTGFFTTNYYDIPIIPEVDQMDLIFGESSSTYLDFWSEDNTFFEITAQNVSARPGWSAGYFVDLEFAVNISSKFPDVNASDFMSAMTDFKLDLTMSANLTSYPSNHLHCAEKFYFAVLEHGGTPPNISDSMSYFNDPITLKFHANTSQDLTVDFDHTTINTTNGMFYFTLHGYNELNATYPTAYKLNIDKLTFRIRTMRLYTIFRNTISNGNYDLAYSFGPSANCPEPHRMFEFRISKSEFPTFPEDYLYIIVAGYGTMSLANTNYWSYPGGIYFNPILGPPNDLPLFLKLDMSHT